MAGQHHVGSTVHHCHNGLITQWPHELLGSDVDHGDGCFVRSRAAIPVAALSTVFATCSTNTLQPIVAALGRTLTMVADSQKKVSGEGEEALSTTASQSSGQNEVSGKQTRSTDCVNKGQTISSTQQLNSIQFNSSSRSMLP